MAEERMGLRGPGLELRMELAAQKPGMPADLDDLGKPPVGGHAGDPETLFYERLLECIVEFIPVPVPLTDLRRIVRCAGKGVLRH